MAKKSRRARAKHQNGGRLPKGERSEHAQASKSTLESRVSLPSVESSPSSAQATRYQYVLPELRRIGIIAGTLFLVLIVLTFILG